MKRDRVETPLDMALEAVAKVMRLDGVDTCIVAYDPRVGHSAVMLVSCPEYGSYSGMAQLLREMADDLDRKMMEDAPCEKHARKN